MASQKDKTHAGAQFEIVTSCMFGGRGGCPYSEAANRSVAQ